MKLLSIADCQLPIDTLILCGIGYLLNRQSAIGNRQCFYVAA